MHQDTDGSLVLCALSGDARLATVARWSGKAWARWDDLAQPLPIAAALPIQDLRFESDAQWLLDRDGALWRGGASWVRVAAPDGGPGRSEGGDRRMAWERGRNRLVVHGGDVENATWCFDPREGRWRELLSHPRPRHGAGGAPVSTPSALHLFVFDELWRLDGDRLREEDDHGGDAAVSPRDAPTDPVTLQLRALCPMGDNDRIAIWVFVEGGGSTVGPLLGVSKVF